MLMAFSLLNKSLLDNVILLYVFETFHNKKNFFNHGTPCLYLQSSPELPMEWDLQFGAPWTNKRGRCQIRKLGSDFANPNMMLIIALICQIFSPKSQLIWLFFKLAIESLLLDSIPSQSANSSTSFGQAQCPFPPTPAPHPQCGSAVHVAPSEGPPAYLLPHTTLPQDPTQGQ